MKKDLLNVIDIGQIKLWVKCRRRVIRTLSSKFHLFNCFLCYWNMFLLLLFSDTPTDEESNFVDLVWILFIIIILNTIHIFLNWFWFRFFLKNKYRLAKLQRDTATSLLNSNKTNWVTLTTNAIDRCSFNLNHQHC